MRQPGVPSELESLRIEGLELLKYLPRTGHLAVHWGMVMAVYPFWSGVAVQVGRILRLQGSVAAAHVQRRIREQYGERETVSRAARRVLRSYLDWGVLQGTGKKGIYTAGTTLAVDDSRLIAWLTEASLHTRAGSPARPFWPSPTQGGGGMSFAGQRLNPGDFTYSAGTGRPPRTGPG